MLDSRRIIRKWRKTMKHGAGPLIGKSIFLRELEESDWREVHEYASQEAVSRFQPWGPNTEEETVVFVQQALEDNKKKTRTRFMFAVISKEEGNLIGAGELNIRDSYNQAGEIGYILNPNSWGKGIGTEVAKLLIQFGFGELDLHRIYATCAPGNAASYKVLEKAGLQREGIMRQHLKLKNGWRDSMLYAILRSEWNEKNL
jgi:[ribosomal protein S5]-alanine N-acetyltransferase